MDHFQVSGSNAVISLTPSKNYRPPSVAASNDTTSPSNQSTPSINSNYFPSYGLIKISNSDDLDSMDSFPLSASLHNYNINLSSNNNSRRASQLDKYALPEEQTANPFYENDTSTKSTTSSPKHRDYKTDSLESQLRNHPEIESVKVPEDGIARSKYCLDKIIDSYRSSDSKGGCFLTKDVFINNKIFKLNETIQNGSVKINIIQEIKELLERFLTNDNSLQPTTSEVETILVYYKKLMDAFDVLRFNDNREEHLRNGSISSSDNNSTLLHHSPQHAYNNDISSVHSNNTNSSGTQRNVSQNQLKATASKEQKTLRKHKKSDSSLLGKIRNNKRLSLVSSLSISSKKTPASTNSSSHTKTVTPKPNISRHASHASSDRSQGDSIKQTGSPLHLSNTHSRSVSISTITTQTSSRSAKDQATINEYFKAVELLQVTIGKIYAEYHHSEDEELCHKLNLIMEFLNDYILKFVVHDVISLSIKLMKENVRDLV